MWTSTSLPANISTAAGHKNAAGGKSYVSMDETIAHYIRSVEEFAREGGLDTPPFGSPVRYRLPRGECI